MLQSFRLGNGLKVATYSIPEMKSVFLSLSVKGGSIFDGPKKSGVAHFMEHMLVQGIPSLPTVDAFSTFIEGLAGNYSALTYNRSIEYSCSAPVSHLKDILEVSGEVFFQPLFPQEAIEREKRAVLEEIRQRLDGIGYKNSKFFAKVRYKKGHPLLLDTGGNLSTVAKLEREDLIKYWSDFFYPGNSYLVLVGGFTDTKIRQQVEDCFGKYQSQKKFLGFPVVTNEDLSNRQLAIRQDFKLKTCYVDLSFASISDQNKIEEHVKQAVVRNILGGLRKSRLYSLLRQKKGLVYDVGTGSIVFPNFGYMYLYCQVAEQKLEDVIRLMIKELALLYKFGPTMQEVEYTKNYVINRSLMQFDHPSAVAGWIVQDLMWEEKVYSPEEYVKIVKSVDQESLSQFMKKCWDFSKLNLVIQGPIKNSSSNYKMFNDLILELQ